MFRAFFELGEFYVAYRILSFAMTVLVALALLIFPTWFLTYVAVGLVIFLICAVPFVLLWAVVTFLNGLKRR
jgi:hypothetical protein